MRFQIGESVVLTKTVECWPQYALEKGRRGLVVGEGDNQSIRVRFEGLGDCDCVPDILAPVEVFGIATEDAALEK